MYLFIIGYKVSFTLGYFFWSCLAFLSRLGSRGIFTGRRWSFKKTTIVHVIENFALACLIVWLALIDKDPYWWPLSMIFANIYYGGAVALQYGKILNLREHSILHRRPGYLGGGWWFLGHRL